MLIPHVAVHPVRRERERNFRPAGEVDISGNRGGIKTVVNGKRNLAGRSRRVEEDLLLSRRDRERSGRPPRAG